MVRSFRRIVLAPTLLLLPACVVPGSGGTYEIRALRSGAQARESIAMGRSSVGLGSANLGVLDPAVIPVIGPDAVGTLRSTLEAGLAPAGLTLRIEHGGAARIEVEGLPAAAFEEGTASVGLGSASGAGFAAGSDLDYTLRGLCDDGSGDFLVLYATPFFRVPVDGEDVLFDSLPTFRFDHLSDIARKGTAHVEHAGVLARITNVDRSHALTGVSGTVSVPGAAAPILTVARIAGPDGGPAPPARVAIAGETFTLSLFSIEPGESRTVLLRFAEPVAGGPLQLELHGSFAP